MTDEGDVTSIGERAQPRCLAPPRQMSIGRFGVSNLAERVGDFGAKTVALHPTPARQQAVGIWSDIAPPTRIG
jgi:hypothetical protein